MISPWAILSHDRVVTGKFELSRNPNCLMGNQS